MTEALLPPGPRVPRCVQAVLWGLRYPEFTRRGHQQFGATFTVRPGTMPPIVLTSDRRAIRTLFTGDPLSKYHANDGVRPLIGERSVMLLEPAEHLARRKLLLPAFHGERVRGYAELMQGLMEEEVDSWRSGETVSVLPAMLNVTIEVILQAVLGVRDIAMRQHLRRLIDDVLIYPLGAIRRRLNSRPDRRFIPPHRIRELTAMLAALPTPAVATYFPELKTRSWINFATLRWWQHRDRLLELLAAQIAATQSDPAVSERQDILAILVQARDESGNALTREDLQDDLIALIGAGHETTAAAIAWGTELLVHNPAVLERASAAVRESDEQYLGALVKEILRIRPPVPVAAGRTLREPMTIGSHTIPAGTPILIDAWGIHHDPAIYSQPDQFEPERFLGRDPQPYTWLPFGGGAHRCIGAALAELEIRIALLTILRKAKITPAETQIAPMARRGITIVPHGGSRIIATQRPSDAPAVADRTARSTGSYTAAPVG